MDIVYSTSHDYYLELDDGSDHLLVARNMPLPSKTQGAFRLMHPEQRLAHFRFYNLVNEERESIGDLWLSFDPDDDSEDSASEKDAREVLLDFEIDEDNLITVGARLKDRPEVRVSRTLSRGNADERLFLELEGAIARVNEEKHEYFTKYEFLFRSGEIAHVINGVIDPETGAEKPKASRQRRAAAGGRHRVGGAGRGTHLQSVLHGGAIDVVRWVPGQRPARGIGQTHREVPDSQPYGYGPGNPGRAGQGRCGDREISRPGDTHARGRRRRRGGEEGPRKGAAV